MAIEYLFNAIRATAGQDICICAELVDDEGNILTENCGLMLHSDKELLTKVEGAYVDEHWNFVIPAEATKGLKGRHWYCICHKDVNLCFKQPIYLL